MADLTEQKIIDRALVAMAAIDGTGGYLTTLGTTLDANGDSTPSVADSRQNWDENELPAIGVFQGEVTVEDRDDEAQQVLRKMNVMFRGAIASGTSPSNCRKFIADIFRAVRAAGDKWEVGGVDLAHRTEEGPHSLIYEEGTFEIAAVQAEINIYYIASHLDMEA